MTFSLVECLFWVSNNAGASPSFFLHRVNQASAVPTEPGKAKEKLARHPSFIHTDSVDRPLTSAACGKPKKDAASLARSGFLGFWLPAQSHGGS